MKKVYLLLAATFMSTPFLMNVQSHAATAQKTAHHARGAVHSSSGTIRMTFHSADVGVGYTWGDGVLHYRGKNYKFKIKGGDVVALGFSKSQAKGRVENLTNLYDFAGKYAAASGEATAGVGVGASSMKNTKNVVIRFDTNTMGGRLAGAPGGFDIKFADSNLQKAAETNGQYGKNVKSAHKAGHATTTDELNQEQLNKVSK